MGRPRKVPISEAVIVEREGKYYIVQGKKEIDAGRSRRYAEKLLKDMQA